METTRAGMASALRPLVRIIFSTCHGLSKLILLYAEPGYYVIYLSFVGW